MTEIYTSQIDDNFIQECNREFVNDPKNIVERNAIVSIGSLLATTNSDRLNEISHIFMNSIKRKDVKATNQGMSGRCWMFSGLNIFRHMMIEALGLENFEFSETYLFFYDKLEKSNNYIQWFIENPDKDTNDRIFEHILEYHMGDGGYWNYFANLVEKYGLIPKSAMNETWQSGDSEDMNHIIEEQLRNCVQYIYKSRMSKEDKNKIKNETMKKVYNILVKFLGTPPNTFEWSYKNEEDVSNIVGGFTPLSFKQMILPTINMSDFVVISNMPNYEYKKKYRIKHSSNMEGGIYAEVLNMPIDEMEKYAKKSITAGMGVWFAADVRQDFNPYHSILDDKLSDDSGVFERPENFKKSDRLKFGNLQANHAMLLTGFNVDKGNQPISWQVENSWGYWDNEVPGADGFLYMSKSWFRKYVMEIVVHRGFLSRTMGNLMDKDVIELEPWSSFGKTLKVSGTKIPDSYRKMVERKKEIIRRGY